MKKIHPACTRHPVPRRLALMITAMLAGQPLFAQAAGENIVWSDADHTAPLRSEPVFGSPDSLFPDGLTGNTVTISGGPLIGGYVFGGVTATDSEVSGNEVDISGGEVGGVYGGVSGDGIATGNLVDISGGKVGDAVYGGKGKVSAADNEVYISGGEVGRVYGGDGGEGADSAAADNKVYISGGEVVGRVYGGYTVDGSAIGNLVEISGGKVLSTAASTFIIGGHGNFAAGNKVYIFGGEHANSVVIAGDGVNGIATGNLVEMSGGKIDEAWGGYGDVSAADNKVYISGGEVGSWVYGGLSRDGIATSNLVDISGGEVGGLVYGGASWYGIATGNLVEISGGKVLDHVYGGYGGVSAADNEVYISGGELRGSVHGGYSESGSAINNTVTLSGMPQFSLTETSIYGGYADNVSSAGDIFTGNTLNFSAAPISVNTVANFQYYNFTLDPGLANDMGTALITADTVKLGDGNGMPSEVKVIGIRSGDVLSVGDQFLLVTATGAMSGDGIGGVRHSVGQQGISLLYEVQTTVDVAGKQITATILSGVDPGPSVNPRLKSLSEGRLSGLMLATRGADAVAYGLYDAILAEKREGLVPFILATGGHSRYESGSHIDSDDFLLTGGLSYRRAGLTAGVFAEGGWGSYDSYNSFAHAASVHGDGNTRYYGGGVFGRYDFTGGVYAEASVRLGSTRTRFDTGDLVNAASGESAGYNLSSRYTSAHAGVGYPWVFNDSSLLDVSVKYLWTHVQGKDATVGGDPLHFDSLDSRRLRLNGEYRYRSSDSLTLLAGLGYEYEFDARAHGTAYGYAIDAPSLKGSTGILSLGAMITPTSNRRLSVDLRGQGYAGKRQGVGGSVRMNYAF
uniref:autotransporter outer membrane beta-barrel domain-containing protein n=1 Tax=Castellaniella defragrans TaxID=75697 RepID=UPI00333FEF0B